MTKIKEEKNSVSLRFVLDIIDVILKFPKRGLEINKIPRYLSWMGSYSESLSYILLHILSFRQAFSN